MATLLPHPPAHPTVALTRSVRRARSRSTPAERWLVVAFLAFAATLKVFMAGRAPIGPDEFQHLHAAWCISVGQTPYVDFFEHHPPFLYYLLQPVFWLFSPGFGLILAARGLMLALNGLIGYAVYCLARSCLGRRTAWWALALLASDMLFFERGFWVLTDVPAVLLTLTSALCLSRAYRVEAGGWFFASSSALGSAILFTPKVIYLGLAVAVWFAIYLGSSRDGGQRIARLRSAGIYLAGGLVPWGILILLIGLDAMGAFWQSNVVLNLHWKARHWPLPHVRHMLVSNGPLWIAAVAGVFWSTRRMGRRASRWLSRGPVTLYFVALVVGAARLPVVWEEYFVEVAPYGAILGACALQALGRWLSSRPKMARGSGRPIWQDLAAPALSAMLAGALVYNFYRATEVLTTGVHVLCLASVVFLVALVFVLRRTERRRWVGTAIVALLLILPLSGEATLAIGASNQEHREAVAFVLAQTKPDESVFDGYMGYGVFRPHAYWWWFLHDEVQLMLPAQETGHGIVDALMRRRPKVVLYDCWIEQLGPPVHDYLRAHYRPTAYDQIWLRLDSPPGIGETGTQVAGGRAKIASRW
jgi:4-amino-4-deoxy-L-arabinose transferase-like glycosyltransferase